MHEPLYFLFPPPDRAAVAANYASAAWVAAEDALQRRNDAAEVLDRAVRTGLGDIAAAANAAQEAYLAYSEAVWEATAASAPPKLDGRAA